MLTLTVSKRDSSRPGLSLFMANFSGWLTRARVRPGFVDGVDVEWTPVDDRRSASDVERSPTVGRLRAMPQAGGIFGHDNLLVGHAGCAAGFRVAMTHQGDGISPAGVT